MYKIYVNNNLLVLAKPNDPQLSEYQQYTRLPYLGVKRSLYNVIDKLEKNPDEITMVVTSDDLSGLWQRYQMAYKKIKAAGGVVFKGNEALFIERLGCWDLPKGKRDPGENNKETALREVEEETGLRCLLQDKIGRTYHTYRDRKGKRVLKKTTWYFMQYTIGEVRVQTSENITNHKWIEPSVFLSAKYNTYNSIRAVIEKLLQF